MDRRGCEPEHGDPESDLHRSHPEQPGHPHAWRDSATPRRGDVCRWQVSRCDPRSLLGIGERRSRRGARRCPRPSSPTRRGPRPGPFRRCVCGHYADGHGRPRRLPTGTDRLAKHHRSTRGFQVGSTQDPALGSVQRCGLPKTSDPGPHRRSPDPRSGPGVFGRYDRKPNQTRSYCR